MMVKSFKQVNIPAHKETQIKAMFCDLCGKEAKYPHDDWDTREFAYAVKETTIKMKDGTNTPDGGWGKEISFDICLECFRDKLMVWLKEQGAEPRIQDWDW